MPTYRVEVSREWTEPGEVVVEAADEEEARDIVQEMLSDGDGDIEWRDMDPGKDCVESVTEEDD